MLPSPPLKPGFVIEDISIQNYIHQSDGRWRNIWTKCFVIEQAGIKEAVCGLSIRAIPYLHALVHESSMCFQTVRSVVCTIIRARQLPS